MASLFAGPVGNLAKAAVGLGAVGWVAQASLFTVGPGERAFLYDHYGGLRDGVYKEGMHFCVPLLQYPIHMDTRTRPRTISTVTPTKDLQQVNVALRILSRPDEPYVKEIFQRYNLDFDARILPSIANEQLKAIVANYNAEQLLVSRETVSAEIRRTLTARARQFNIILDDISITHLTFSKDFAEAIEYKEVALQQAETAKFRVQRAEQERRAMVIQSEGDAEAAKLVSDAIAQHGAGLIEMRRIETAAEIARTLSGATNVTYLPGGASGEGGNVLLGLNTRR